MGLAFMMTEQGGPRLEKIKTLLSVEQDLLSDGIGSAMKTLLELEGAGFPPEFEALRLMLLAQLFCELDEFQTALEYADRTTRVHDDIPRIHLTYCECYNGLGQHEKALEHAALHADLLGVDGDYFTQVGDAHAGLGRTDLAIAAYRQGLVDDDQSGWNVLGLMLLMPTVERDTVIEYYRALNDVDQWFVAFADGLLVSKDAGLLRTLIDLHEGVLPDDENIPLYREELKELE